MRDCTVKLGDVDWTIRFVTRRWLPTGWWGCCDWNDKEIRILKTLSRKNLLDTLIHEMRHAQHPIAFEAESYIDTTSTEIANGLIKTGVVD